jgi:hypothetical protein
MKEETFMTSNAQVSSAWIATFVLMLGVGCMESYKPGISTETGNPPVIDSDRIALVVTRDEVHVQGEPGAVTPPEGEIEIKILRNEEVVRGPVASDGSFDVEVGATLDDVFEVRAVSGSERSLAVIVVRGGAMVGEGEGGVLTCEQKSTIAYDTVTQAITNADRSCTTDTDCMLASPDSTCFAGCGYEYVSTRGMAGITAVIEALDQGFCEDFEDGCERIIPPCVPPDAPRCFAGECQSGAGGTTVIDGGPAEPEPDCTSDFDIGDCDAAIPAYWHDPQTGACVPVVYGGCGGNDNRYPSLEACQAACAPPSAQSDCAPGHTLDTTCFECPMTNCTDPQTTCSLECEIDQDCASLSSASGAVSYVCNASDNLCMPALSCP